MSQTAVMTFRQSFKYHSQLWFKMSNILHISKRAFWDEVEVQCFLKANKICVFIVTVFIDS